MKISAIPAISGDTEAAPFFKIEGLELLSDTLNNANAPDNLSAGIAVKILGIQAGSGIAVISHVFCLRTRCIREKLSCFYKMCF